MQDIAQDLPPQEETHLKDYLDVLWRRRVVVLAAFAAVVLAVGVYSLGVYPTYESTATIMLDDEKGAGIPFLELSEFTRTDERVNTQVKVLQSRTVAENVVQRVGLRLQREPQERMYRLLLKRLTASRANGKPEPPSGVRLKAVRVDEAAAAGEYTATFEDETRFAVTDQAGAAAGAGALGSSFSGRGFAFTAEGKGKPGKRFHFTIVSLPLAMEALAGSMKVSPIRNSALLEMKVIWNDAAMAREVGDAVIAAYKDIMVSKRTREASQVLAFIEDQTKDVEKDLLKAEENLRKFKEKQGIIALEADVKSALERVAGYEKEFKSVQNYRKQAEIVLASLHGSGTFSEKEGLFSLGAGLNNNLLVALGTKLSELTVRRSALLSGLKDQHPRVIEVTREVENVKQRIAAELSGLIASLKASEKELQANLRQHEDKVRNLPAAEKELFGLERLTRVGQAMNSFLLQKRAEMSVTKASELGNFWVVDPASMPDRPAKPRLKLNLLLAIVAGGMCSLMLAFFLDYLDTSVKTPEQLAQVAGLPFLGTVFHVAGNGKPAAQPAVLADPRSAVTEAFLAVRTNLLFTFLGEEKKVLLVTSTVPSEGKTFVTANLGAVLAKMDKRVLLVEADLRKPGLSRAFGVERSPGLTNVLLSGVAAGLPAIGTAVPGLDIMPAGDLPPNPTDLLGSDRMQRFLDAARERYDVVLIDTPPALGFSDALVLGGKAEGIVFVARSGQVQRDILKEALDRFASLDAKLLGIILNDVQPFDTRHYGYRYKYYAYYEEDGKRTKKRRGFIRSKRDDKVTR
jgi:capsular exopolysaccharide synthesis family protein